jgi:hypothetical protein
MKINVWAVLFGVVAIFCIVLQVESCHQDKYYSSIISSKDDTVRTWQDEAGRWRAEATTATVSKKDLQEFFSMESEQIRKDFDTKLKNVTGYLRSSMQTTGTVAMKADSGTKVIIQNLNGSDTAVFHYTDIWSHFDAILHNSQLQLSYRVHDSIAFVSSIKRNGLFGPTHTVLNGISYNPNTKISGITGIDIKVPDRKFGIGPYIGYGWNGSSWSPSVGISVHYSLVKF